MPYSDDALPSGLDPAGPTGPTDVVVGEQAGGVVHFTLEQIAFEVLDQIGDDDDTLAAESDDLLPTKSAVRGYVADAIADIGSSEDSAVRTVTQPMRARRQLGADGVFRDTSQVGTGVLTAGTIATITDDSKYNAWPVICRLRGNRLLLAYTKGDSHHGDTTGKAVYKVGTENLDGTISWGTETTIHQDTTPRWVSVYGVTQLSTGRIIATLWRDTGSGTTGTAGYVYSDDDMATWSAWQDLGTPSGYSESYCTGPALELRNGDVLVSLEVDNTGSSSANRSSIVMRSTDGGTTFGSPTTVRLYATDTRTQGESKLVLLADDTILIIHRNSITNTPGTHYTQKSTDGGATWSAPVLAFSGFGSPGCCLLSTGTLIALTRKNSDSSLIAYTSTDNAVTWSALTSLDATMYEMEYAFPVELSDGRILVVYGYQVTSSLSNADIKSIIVTETKADVGVLSGDVTSTRTGVATLASTAVTPGSYTSSNITVDAKGRITAAANGSSGGGVTYTDRSALRVIGDRSGANFVDKSPSARTLTASGNATQGTTPVGTGPWSIVLDGTGDYISVPDSSAWNSSAPFTWEALFYVDAAAYSGSSVYYTMLGQSSTGNPTRSLALLTSSTTVAAVAWADKNATVFVANLTGGVIAPRTQHHAAVCGNGVGTMSTLFVDGVRVAGADMDVAPSDLTSALLIGAWSDAGAYFSTRDFLGNLKVRVSNYARYNRANFTPPTDFGKTDIADVGTSAWNPSDKGASIVLGDSNYIASITAATHSVRGVAGFNAASADVTFETTIAGTDTTSMVGIGNSSASLTTYPGGDVNGYGLFANNGHLYHNGDQGALSGALAVGDVVTHRISSGTYTVSVNGAVPLSMATGLTGTWYPMFGGASGSGGPRTAILNTGRRPFDYAASDAVALG